jgi:hypothetical protein
MSTRRSAASSQIVESALRIVLRLWPNAAATIRPNTSNSISELPPRRFAPCSPPPTSPAANRPGTLEAWLSASTRTPPIM